jgi:hypothetical protein
MRALNRIDEINVMQVKGIDLKVGDGGLNLGALM